ncbi:Cdc6/Cdc18 family protein [Haladaptatus sp. ZSTT2]|uniref:Cdc6/Cdc18 family protein n=1 Tax=Haladaptatus sp. ZSTT2 TaxID=3120515 RepID=UPI00300E768A
MSQHESNTPDANGPDAGRRPAEVGLFDELLTEPRLFKQRDKLRPAHTPVTLPHRTTEIASLAGVLAGTLHGETTAHVLLYGKTGTGKTACVRSVTRELERAAARLERHVTVVYVNCEVTDTQYQILAHLTNVLVESNRALTGDPNAGPEPVPMTGFPTEVVYDTLIEAASVVERSVIVVLDEVDQLASSGGDSVLYNLARLNGLLDSSRVTLVGISNDLTFTESLDPRVRSRLGTDEIVFPPYDAGQLTDIITERAAVAFEPGVIDAGVFALVAALAAQEHGDARRALDLLRVAGELAERDGAQTVTEAHVRDAKARVEFDHTEQLVDSLPTQSKLVLLAVADFPEGAPVEGVHERYTRLCTSFGMEPLSGARMSSAFGDLDSLGLVTVASKTRPRRRDVRLSLRWRDLRRILAADSRFANLASE